MGSESQHAIKLGQRFDALAEIMQGSAKIEMGIDILIIQFGCLAQVQFGLLVFSLIQEFHSQKEVGTCQTFLKFQVVRPTSKAFSENFNGVLVTFLLSRLISHGEVEALFLGKSLESLQGDIVQSLRLALHLIQST